MVMSELGCALLWGEFLGWSMCFKWRSTDSTLCEVREVGNKVSVSRVTLRGCAEGFKHLRVQKL